MSTKSSRTFSEFSITGLGYSSRTGKRKKVTWNLYWNANEFRYAKRAKKKKHEKWNLVPLNLVWIQDKIILEKGEDVLVKRELSFSLLIPCETLKLVASNSEEKKKIVNELRIDVNAALKDLGRDPDSDRRTGNYIFPGIGSYNGSWKLGNMHGKGTFQMENGIVFNGHWHYMMKAGFGEITKLGEIPIKDIGWSYGNPFTGVFQDAPEETVDLKKNKKSKYVNPNDLVVGEDEVLTKQDLEILYSSKGISVVKYEANTVILHEGVFVPNIFRIKSGEVLRTRNVRGQPVSKKLAITTMFGEMAIFDKKATYSFIALTDVELYVMDIASLYRLFTLNRGLSKRFNLQLAKMLAHRLSNVDVDESNSSNNLIELEKSDTLKLPEIPQKLSEGALSEPLESNNSDYTSLDDYYVKPPIDRLPHRRSRSSAEILPSWSIMREFSSNNDSNPNQTSKSNNTAAVQDVITIWSHFWGETNTNTIYIADDVFYRDPFTSQPLTNKNDLLKHRDSLLESFPTWNWNVAESIRGESMIALKAQLTISENENVYVSESSSIWLTFCDSLVTKIEVMFDTGLLHSKYPQKVPKSHPSKSNTSSKLATKDKKLLFRKNSEELILYSHSDQISESSDTNENKIRRKKSDPLRSNLSEESSDERLKDKLKKGNNLEASNARKNDKRRTIAESKKSRLDDINGGKNAMSLNSLPSSNRRERSISSGIGPTPRIQQPRKLPQAKKEVSNDPSWEEKFDLSQNDSTLIKEFQCVLEFGYSLNYNGTLYISNKYLCFFSGFFGLNTKEVVSITTIERCRRKENSNTISMKLNKKKAARARPKPSHPHILFTFSTYNECTEALQIINKLWESVKKETDEEEVEASPRIVESFIQREIRLSTIDKSIPNIELKNCSMYPALRFWGPNPKSDGLRSDFGNEIYATSISTYPRESKLHDIKQGDPICDQFMLERYENRTLVAIADGCAWGEKTRTAARLAAQTFLEFNKKSLFEAETTQQAMRTFLNSFATAHHRIIEGKEEKWWECGTTTLLGGCIVELADEQHPWAFVCLSVGDCKAYRISPKEKEFEYHDMTIGSRRGVGAIDARDCGGRLGPFKSGNPDLRNLLGFFHYLEEGDYVMLCSDGVYDNIDPQSLGLDPKELGFEDFNNWEDVEEACEKPENVELFEKVENAKHIFSMNKLKSLIDEMMTEKGLQPKDVEPSHIVEKIMNHCVKVTENIRNFMEDNPNEKQPHGKEYTGKVDHTTCVVVKTGKTNFRQIEADLEDLVVRLRHPTYGVTKEAEGTQQGTFKGLELERWLKQEQLSKETNTESENKLPFTMTEVPQALMNFNFIGPVTANESYIFETFQPDILYQFKVYEPIMTRRDWEIIQLCTTRKTYHPGDVIIEEGSTQYQIYQLDSGTCRVQRSLKKRKSLKDKKIPKRTTKRTTLSNNSTPPKVFTSTNYQSLGTIGAPQTFGELSLLSGGKASASVIAETEVNLLVIERHYINIMFVRYPDMAGRFYHYLSSVLARRLSFHEAGKENV